LSNYTDVRIVKKTMKGGLINFYVEVFSKEKWHMLPCFGYSGIYYALEDAIRYKESLLNQIIIIEEVVV